MASITKARLGNSLSYYHPTSTNPQGRYMLEAVSEFYWSTTDVQKPIREQSLTLQYVDGADILEIHEVEIVALQNLKLTIEQLLATNCTEGERLMLNRFLAGLTSYLDICYGTIIGEFNKTLILQQANKGIIEFQARKLQLLKERNQLHKSGVIVSGALVGFYLTLLPWTALLYVQVLITVLILINRVTGYEKEKKEDDQQREMAGHPGSDNTGNNPEFSL